MSNPIRSTLVPFTLCLPLALGAASAEEVRSRPKITSFAPASGPVGTTVTIAGSGFSARSSIIVFSGNRSAPVIFVSASQIKVVVPQGAQTGRFTLYTRRGRAQSPSSFQVTGTTALAITAIAPGAGPVGSVVTITGTGFAAGAAVSFNGTAATAVTYVSATQLKATVPAGATSGSIKVTVGSAVALSPTAFTVQTATGLSITSFTPAQGPVGTVVTINGSGFATGAKVAFHGTAATAVTYVSATQLRATVPAGTTSGLFTVTVGTGTATSASPFTIQNGTSSLDLAIGGWYINQSVQTLGRTMPLVAGKKGLLRVFTLANAANTAAPKVRVTVTGGSPSPWVQTISAPASSVPTALAEGTLASSWNIAVPGAVLAAGGTLKVEVDPDGAILEANKANNTLTAALDVRKLATFRTTILAVTQQGLTANVTSGGRTLEDWVGLFRAMYPLGDGGAADLDVKLGAPYTTQANLNSGSGGWSTLLSEINNKRVAEGTGRYYYGAVHVSYNSGLAGLGYIGAPAALGWDKNEFNRLFAHETGHNFNRKHTPCGGASGTDSNWPSDSAHASANIGVYGYDTSTGTAKGPSAFKDVMSYCTPVWVSDYTYKNILDWRAAGRFAPGVEAEESALPPLRECLLVSGHVRNGQLALDPAYMVCTRPELPEPGDYRLELKDSEGATLAEVPFGTLEVADHPGQADRSFSFALPMDAKVAAAYHALRVVTPMGGLLTRNAGPGEIHQLPTATPYNPGEVRIQWDAKAFPTAMVRDPATRGVLAFAREGLLDLKTEAKELEITLSDGVRSKRLRMATGIR